MAVGADLVGLRRALTAQTGGLGLDADQLDVLVLESRAPGGQAPAYAPALPDPDAAWAWT